MSRVIACLVAFVLAPAVSAQVGGVAGAIGPAGQTPRDNARQRTGTCVIRGRIVAADNSLPLRRVIVRLISSELREGKSTTTDSEGRYEFKDLPSGRYSVAAQKTGYVPMNYGARRPNEAGRPLELADAQRADRVDFTMLRGGAITGRVIDEFGEPVPNAMVQPTQHRFVNGQRRLTPTGSSDSTPDTGEYRLWGLAPGNYYVSVTVRNMFGAPYENSDDRSGYAPAYFPGTGSLAEAQPITIAAGQVASGVDVTLVPIRTAKVSGIAVDFKGDPLRSGYISAEQRTIGFGTMSNAGGQVRPDGTFTVTGLTPGDYVLRSNIPAVTPGVRPEMLAATVIVSGEDVAGVVLMPVQPATVTGRIVFDPPTSAVQPAMVRVNVMPKSPEANFFSMPTEPPVVKDDFTFALKSSPGVMVIRTGLGSGPGVTLPPGLIQQWMLKAVRHDDADVTDSGLDLASGSDVNGVEIVLTNRLPILTGRILDPRTGINAEGTVVVFSQSREHWTGFGRHVGLSRPDRTGKYMLRGLAPGDYFALAVDRLDSERSGGDPDYYEELSRDAVRLSLAEGETRILDLKLVVWP